MNDKPKSAWSYWPPAGQWLTVWDIPVLALIGVFGSVFLNFLSGLTGRQWMGCYGLAAAVAMAGWSLIFYAKLPLLMRRQFFAFGSRTIPESRRTFYRWGYKCVACAVVLLLCLLVPRL